MSIPKIIHQVWLSNGGDIPSDLRAYMHGMALNHPDWKYKLWTRHNMDQVLPNDAPRFKCPASMSNVIRLYAVNMFGGVYCDCDVESIKPFDDELLQWDAFAGEQGVNDSRVCNAVFGASAGSPWLRWQIENIKRLSEDGATGVYLMSEAPRYLGVSIFDYRYFYPFHWSDPPEKRVPKPESYCVHWWNGSWTKGAVLT